MARLLGLFVERDRNYEGSRRELGVGERLIAQFLASIGGIGKQLAQENIAIRIDRMHHKMQQFGDIRLKSLTVTLCLRHLQRPPFRVPMGFIDFGGRTLMARRCLVARILPPPAPDARPSRFFRRGVFAIAKIQSAAVPALCRKSVKRMLAPPPSSSDDASSDEAYARSKSCSLSGKIIRKTR